MKKPLSRRGKLTSRRNLLKSAAELFDKDDESDDDQLPIRSQENLVKDSFEDDDDEDQANVPYQEVDFEDVDGNDEDM